MPFHKSVAPTIASLLCNVDPDWMSRKKYDNRKVLKQPTGLGLNISILIGLCVYACGFVSCFVVCTFY